MMTLWYGRCSVMVLKKLGEELMEEYISVLRFLGEDQGLRILVEPNDFAELVSVSYVDVALKVICSERLKCAFNTRK